MPKLVVTDEGRTWLFDLDAGESVVLGRAPECDLVVEAPRASRRHLEIAPRSGGHVLRDLGSTNGTSWNGAPVVGEVPLGDGDVVEAGGCRLVYRSRP